jgi:hypothetical protein
MKTVIKSHRRQEQGAILAYLIILLIALISIAALGAYVSQTSKMALRRSNVSAAYQYAVGGAVVVCSDLNSAMTNNSGNVLANLLTLSTPYTVDSGLSTPSQKVYARTISSPFAGQTVSAQIWVSNVASPNTARIVTAATVGTVAQQATLNVKMAWAYPAAIISVNDGTTDTSVAKSAAQDGNVVINGDRSGPIVVDGGPALAVLANGRVNMDTNYVNPPANSYSMTNYNTANAIPDYTSQGTSNTLFDIPRFVAVANATPNGPSPSRNNHFTNILSFINAAKTTYTNTAHSMEGVVVIDVAQSDPNMNQLTDSTLPGGVNVKGTLLFNFLGTGWNPTTSKIIITADVNVNPADLSHLVATNPATYTTGYPPVYTDPTKNPASVNIAPAYQNFSAIDDLPALVYSIGVVDLHGNLNISGVCYTPSYMEIENKADGQTQYIRGTLIMGNGIYYENTHRSTSIISFDAAAVDALATLNNAGKQVKVAYWQ